MAKVVKAYCWLDCLADADADADFCQLPAGGIFGIKNLAHSPTASANAWAKMLMRSATLGGAT